MSDGVSMQTSYGIIDEGIWPDAWTETLQGEAAMKIISAVLLVVFLTTAASAGLNVSRTLDVDKLLSSISMVDDQVMVQYLSPLATNRFPGDGVDDNPHDEGMVSMNFRIVKGCHG